MALLLLLLMAAGSSDASYFPSVLWKLQVLIRFSLANCVWTGGCQKREISSMKPKWLSLTNAFQSQAGVGLARLLTVRKAMAKQGRYHRLRSGDLNSDQQEKSNKDIYCKALAKTLEGITPPLTVGFYAPWGRKKRRLLDKVEDYLKRAQNNPGTVNAGSICSMLSLLSRIILFDPVAADPKGEARLPPKSENCVQYIFISFNAWEYVGCDYTWAGIVTTLLDEIEKRHKWCFAAFRCFGGDFQEKSNEDKWTLKPKSIYFGGILFMCVSLIPLACLWSNVVVAAVLTGGTLTFISIPFLLILRKLFFTMKRNIQKQMNRKDLSIQLGFMHSVKNEVGTMIRFLKVLEFHEGKEIRVVLRITNLDICAPDKVVSVLDAIRILLSDQRAPFISILAADPSILVRCIKQSNNTCRNGYLYLDRIVSLPFSLPPMNLKEKRELLSEALKTPHQGTCPNGEQTDMCIDVNETEAVKGVCKDSCVESLTLKNVKDNEDVMSRMAKNEEFAGIRWFAYKQLKKNEYLPGNYVEMHRVVNTVLTIQYMLHLGYEFDPPLEEKSKKSFMKEVIDWVILANSWPCRLSWLLQCEEDKRQRISWDERGVDRNSTGAARDSQEAANDGSESLFTIYQENDRHLDKIKEKIQELLELDGDPDLFEKMLQEKKNNFTVKRARYIPNILINLDFSLKRKFELLEDLHNTYRKNDALNSKPPNSPDRGTYN